MKHLGTIAGLAIPKILVVVLIIFWINKLRKRPLSDKDKKGILIVNWILASFYTAVVISNVLGIIFYYYWAGYQ